MNFFSKSKEYYTDIEAGAKPALFQSFLGNIGSKANSIVETAENYRNGAILIGIGFCLLFSSTIFLPFFIISPYKFCIMFSFGSFSIFSGIFMIKEYDLVKVLFSEKYIYFTALFLGSFLAEFYFAVIDKQYILVIVFLFVYSLNCVYLILAAVPGGVQLTNFVLLSGLRALKSLVIKF